MAVNPDQLLEAFIENNGSDLYLTVGAMPTMRANNHTQRLSTEVLSEEDIQTIIAAILSEEAISEFEATLEYNTAFDWKNKARMRVNLFRQRQSSGMVLRRINSEIPTLKSLTIPEICGELVMKKRGLILVVGPTGSGKSTTLASMIGHRNANGEGHIVTIEDPIEFLHDHNKCIITQRDVGIDTYSYSIGLKNALRQMPDVIMIGEIRDRETMDQAITFAETGHLCLATLHANNAHQAVERIINLFPEEKQRQVMMNLSFNLRAIISQRLIRNLEDGRSIITEIMLNEGLIKNLILDGRINEIRDMIEKGYGQGMRTFEQSLMELIEAKVISEQVAMTEADNPASLRMAMKEKGLHKYTEPTTNMLSNVPGVNNEQF